MQAKPTKTLLDNNTLNPEVITYNRQLLAIFRILMLLYKLDVHTMKDFLEVPGYAPKLITTSGPLYQLDVDYKVPLKTIKRYGEYINV